MSYDNSQLARVYLHAWQVTGNEFFRTITEEILDYVIREMTYVGAGANDGNAGGIAFYSTQGADSDGEEGKFFVWTIEEIPKVLSDVADSFGAACGLTRHGNTSTGIARLYDTSYDHTPSGAMLSQYPLGFGQWLQALAYVLSKPREIAIVGDPNSADTQALLDVVRDGYRPFHVVALGSPHADRPDREEVQLARVRQLPSNAADGVGSIAAVPLLQERGLVEGHAAAYVCDAPVPGRALSEGTGLACQAPVAGPEGLQSLLETH